MDYNQDGIAELVKVVTANDASRVLLRRDGEPDIEPVDEIPLEWITPVPMPHKLAGHSIADLVMDLQQIKSTLMRQILDNIYLTNVPRTIVSDGAANENTYADIMRARPGQLIRARDAAGIVTHTTPFVASAAFPIMEYIDQTHEVRTGISRHNQGLNPDDLNKTATGVNLIQQAAAQRVELIARIFARGVQALVRGILQIVRRHQQQARIIMATGKPLTMDPRLWKSELAVNVSVGLGTGNRDQILAHLMTILQLQQGIVQVQQGVSGPLVYGQNVYDALEKLTENGFESFSPIQPASAAAAGPASAQADPRDDVQAKAQAEQQRAQAQIQINQQRPRRTPRSPQARRSSRRSWMNRAAMEMHEGNGDAAAHDAGEHGRAEHARLEEQKMQHELVLGEREGARADLAEREMEGRLARQAQQPEVPPLVEASHDLQGDDTRGGGGEDVITGALTPSRLGRRPQQRGAAMDGRSR
jgi:hypothetical protein